MSEKDDKVVELRPGDLSLAGPSTVIDADRVLETSKGRFEKVFIVGIENDKLVIKGSHNAYEAHWYLARAQRELEGCFQQG